MTSWLRPSKRSVSVCVPCAPSKVYCLSTSSQGRSRRSRLSWSRSRVNSFSFARCFFRALSHSSCFTTLWVAMSSLLLTLSRSLEVGPQESKPRQDPYTPASHLFTALPRLASQRDTFRNYNPKVVGSNPAPATIDNEGLADGKT